MDNTIRISGKKLAALRRRRFMTQEEVARELKISTSRVSAIEARDVTGIYLGNFKNLAALFKMHPDDLLKELAAEREGISLHPIPTGVLDGLKARAALEDSTLDEWLERQATLTVTVHDALPPPNARGRGAKKKKKRGSARVPHLKPAESPEMLRHRNIQ